MIPRLVIIEFHLDNTKKSHISVDSMLDNKAKFRI